MESVYWVHLMVVLCLGTFMGIVCQDGADEVTAVYIVTLKQTPTSHYYGELRKGTNVFRHGVPGKLDRLHTPRFYLSSLIFGFRVKSTFLVYSISSNCFSYEILELFCFHFTPCGGCSQITHKNGVFLIRFLSAALGFL